MKENPCSTFHAWPGWQSKQLLFVLVRSMGILQLFFFCCPLLRLGAFRTTRSAGKCKMGRKHNMSSEVPQRLKRQMYSLMVSFRSACDPLNKFVAEWLQFRIHWPFIRYKMSQLLTTDYLFTLSGGSSLCNRICTELLKDCCVSVCLKERQSPNRTKQHMKGHSLGDSESLLWDHMLGPGRHHFLIERVFGK